MNRAELIDILEFKNALAKTAVHSALETLVDTIQTTVKKGGVVELVGFGTFKSVKHAARVRRHPSTGENLKVAASTVPRFSAGSKFKAAVDPNAAKRKADKVAKK